MEKGSDTVNVFGRNPINIAFLPAEKGPALINEMREDLFPFEKIYTDVLECGLALRESRLARRPRTVQHFPYRESPGQLFPVRARLDALCLPPEHRHGQRAQGHRRGTGYNLRPMEDFAGRPEDYKWTWQDLYKEGHGSIGLTPICGPNDIGAVI